MNGFRFATLVLAFFVAHSPISAQGSEPERTALTAYFEKVYFFACLIDDSFDILAVEDAAEGPKILGQESENITFTGENFIIEKKDATVVFDFRQLTIIRRNGVKQGQCKELNYALLSSVDAITAPQSE